jgi:putative RecB family exonuclease
MTMMFSRNLYSYSHLQRFASCPRSFQLHYVERLDAERSEASHFGTLLHRTCELAMHAHVAERRIGSLEPGNMVRAYQTAWKENELSDPARFEEGLEIAKAWAARQGWVDWEQIVGTEMPFSLFLGEYQIVGKFDRVDNTGKVLRVRDYKSCRIPMSREEVEGSLQLAIYDLAACMLWPRPDRVELEVELLRHGTVIRTTRTEAQRQATRAYILATIAKIEAAEFADDYETRPSLQCTSCDHRSQCPAYADALAAKRTFVCTDEGDLAAVSREREEVARLVKVLSTRKDVLEAILKNKLRDVDELRLGGVRYTMGKTTNTEYPIGSTLEALKYVTEMSRDQVLERVASVSAPALRKLVDELAATRTPNEARHLRASLEALALRTFSPRLVAKEDRTGLDVGPGGGR